jgi:hypothetical protein
VTAATDSRWTMHMRGDPLTWLLDEAAPAVRHLALLWLLDRRPDDVEVVAAQHAAMSADPIASILAAQHPSGYWEKPGPGYATKYRGTVWQLIFLDQLGAEPADARVRTACEYVLAHTQASSGGFLASGCKDGAPPPPPRVIHCLTGNLLRALLGFGWLDDPRVSGQSNGRRGLSPAPSPSTTPPGARLDQALRAWPTQASRALGERSKRCWRWPGFPLRRGRHWSSGRFSRESPSC